MMFLGGKYIDAQESIAKMQSGDFNKAIDKISEGGWVNSLAEKVVQKEAENNNPPE